MIKIVLAVMFSLLLGAAGGYQAARMKYKDLLKEKDGQIISLSQTVETTKTQIDQMVAAEKEKESVSKTFIMRDGKMMIEENGKTTSMTKQETLDDGSTLSTSGTVTKKNGSKITLKNGESILMDGSIVKEDEEKTTVEKTMTVEEESDTQN